MNGPASDRLLFVVDDDDAVRDSLEAFLDIKGYTVEAFSSGLAFLERVEGLERGACLLLDIRMPEIDGLSVLQAIAEQSLPLQVIMMTGHADVPTAVKAMKTGAFDFIEKPFSKDTILTSVESALETLGEAAPPTSGDPELVERLDRLSPRERDVMARLVDGLTNKEIARDLDISPRTVEVYRAGVMEKMGARNLSGLVRMGLAAGFGS